MNLRVVLLYAHAGFMPYSSPKYGDRESLDANISFNYIILVYDFNKIFYFTQHFSAKKYDNFILQIPRTKFTSLPIKPHTPSSRSYNTRTVQIVTPQ